MISYREAKLYINNKWVYYKEHFGVYSNIIDYFDSNGLSFLKYNYIDFSTIPIIYNGNGNSKNLIEYISNNLNNNNLVTNFLNYFIKLLDFRYVISNDPIIFIMNKTGDWQKNTIYVIHEPEKTLYLLKSDTSLYFTNDIVLTCDRTEIYI